MTKKRSPILEEAKQQMDIVPYTKRDRIVTTTILVIVAANLVLMVVTVLIWGNVSP